ncbi:MAG: aldehyde dehydrogenase family protein [Candidatus Marinimicrobia bacterium]|nr:aldehyde dehydrogenase family protein [Candidatus Neomarinimicrobiota bacterium]
MDKNTHNSNQLQLINPATETPFAEFQLLNILQIEDIAVQSRNTFLKWKKSSLNERENLIRNIIQYFEDNKISIAEDITKQMGRPISHSINEVNGAIYRMNGLLDIFRNALEKNKLPNINSLSRQIIREPLGVILDIAAWNYPLLIAVNIVIASILAGNSVIIKHSSTTPLCGEIFEKAFHFCNAPNGLVQNIICSHQTLATAIKLGLFDHISFTGSVNGGRSVSEANKSNFIGLGLELGGKDPAYICEDSDLEFVIPNIMDGVFYNAGQSCCGVERIYVHESIYDQFIKGAILEMEKLVIGNPMYSETTMGPLASAKAVQFLENQKQDAVKKGASIIEYSKDIPQKGYYIRPFIAFNCTHDMEIMMEESFGPIVGIMKVKSDEEALYFMNDSQFGLTASIWTKNEKRASFIANELEAGTIFLNRCDVLDPELPWVGVKNSGHGASLGEIGIQQLTRPKSFNFKQI